MFIQVKKIITPKKSSIYSEQDKIKIEDVLGKLGGKIATITSVGQGYEPPRGKLPKFTIPPYIPQQYLPNNSL